MGFFPLNMARGRGFERINIPLNYGSKGHAYGFEHILIEN
jgi:hypothetical protein